MSVRIRQAQQEDVETVSHILGEAARWLIESGQPLWKENELLPPVLEADVAAGQFYIAECNGIPAGVVRYQLEDERFWPDVPMGEAAYLHRLAVSRAFAGRGIATALLDWAAARTRELGRTYLRLDCEASRPQLRGLYERYGFRHHSDREVGPYFVSRYELRVC